MNCNKCKCSQKTPYKYTFLYSLNKGCIGVSLQLFTKSGIAHVRRMCSEFFKNMKLIKMLLNDNIISCFKRKFNEKFRKNAYLCFILCFYFFDCLYLYMVKILHKSIA